MLLQVNVKSAYGRVDRGTQVIYIGLDDAGRPSLRILSRAVADREIQIDVDEYIKQVDTKPN